MGNGIFGADPTEMRAKGEHIRDVSSSFVENYKKIFSTVEEMTTSNYLSPEAYAIGQNILSYSEELENMAKVIDNYGVYCINAGNRVISNQNDIIDGIGGGHNE